MKSQFNYLFIGLLYVLYSDSLVYETEASDSNTNELRNNTNIQSSFCDIAVPESVRIDRIWRTYREPEIDDLDVFIINKTGCSYAALGRMQEHEQVTTFDGEVYEWRGGVRAGEDAWLYVWTGPRNGYTFRMGEEGNTESAVYRWLNKTEQFSTPGLLSRERYVWLHLTVEPGRVTLKTECDGSLNITRPFTVERGQKLAIEVRPFAESGAKLLDTCPANVV